MKIGVAQIPFEGLTLAEDFTPQALDLETEIIKFNGPIEARAEISRITNAVTVHLTLHVLMQTSCSRCLEDFEIDFKKNTVLNYPINKAELAFDDATERGVNCEWARTIDLNPQIREEIILDYPIKPLCNLNCKGLCPKCGKNLNKGNCNCV